MSEALIIGGATLTLVGFGLIETLIHRRRLASIPIRVHVNGTRGKSSVTRLIAAGLRAGGVRTIAKTTGTLPRLILPHGGEVPFYRPAGANIIEQKRVVAIAKAQRVQALVIECMALQPHLQWLSEERLVSATHGVVTNARPDHLDVMGPTEVDVAEALAGSTPKKSQMFTAETTHLDIFERAAKARRSKLNHISPEEVSKISEPDLAGFSYREHPDNLALALAVCLSCGVDRQVALAGMWAARPDPGAMTERHVDYFGRRFVFINAFAANDPVSTQFLWESSIERHENYSKKILILNARIDRADRSLQLAEVIPKWTAPDVIVIIGTGQYIFAKALVKAGWDASKLAYAESESADAIFESLLSLCDGPSLLVGIGNIAGPGLAITQYIENRSLPSGGVN